MSDLHDDDRYGFDVFDDDREETLWHCSTCRDTGETVGSPGFACPDCDPFQYGGGFDLTPAELKALDDIPERR